MDSESELLKTATAEESGDQVCARKGEWSTFPR